MPLIRMHVTTESARTAKGRCGYETMKVRGDERETRWDASTRHRVVPGGPGARVRFHPAHLLLEQQCIKQFDTRPICPASDTQYARIVLDEKSIVHV